MVLVNQEAQIAAPIEADSSHLGRGLPRDGSTCAATVIPVERLSPVYRASQDTGRILLTPPPPRARPQACTTAPRALVSPGSTALTSNAAHCWEDVLCTYKATFSDVCLETLSVRSGPSFRANTRPIQPGLRPQAIGSQWDHSCSKNRAHT